MGDIYEYGNKPAGKRSTYALPKHIDEDEVVDALIKALNKRDKKLIKALRALLNEWVRDAK